jgi:hypothetical protein
MRVLNLKILRALGANDRNFKFTTLEYDPFRWNRIILQILSI